MEVASSTFHMADNFVFILYANQHITSNKTIRNEYIWLYFDISVFVGYAKELTTHPAHSQTMSNSDKNF